METRSLPEKDQDTPITKQELDLSWTESEWFQTWLKLARANYQDQPLANED